MERKDIASLKRKTFKIPEGKPRRLTLTIPSKYRPIVKELAKKKYGSIKNVFEHAIRKYIAENPKENDEGYKWTFTIEIPHDLRDEILKRIPSDFPNQHQAFLWCLVKLITSLEE